MFEATLYRQGKSKYIYKFYVFSKSHESQTFIQKLQQSLLIVISYYSLLSKNVAVNITMYT